MKLFQKKKDNKGFSLVELIVVVAIMAVLMGVLVPTLVRNVEKSKHQKDINGLSEVANAIQDTMADEKYSTATGTIDFTGDSFTIDSSSPAVSGLPTGVTAGDFWTEVCKNLDGEDATKFEFKYGSKLANSGTKVVFVLANEKVTAAVKGGDSKKYNTQENILGEVDASNFS